MSDRALRWCVRATVALPFVVALIALSRRHWAPVLDLAMTELRVRDVGGGDTPLIGLPGRIGKFPDQGSHPGPLSFYLLAPTYRLFGSSAFGLLAAAVVVNVAAAWAALWVAARHGGRRLFLATAALLMTALAWLGANVLTQPWNPYLPLVAFVLTVIAGWAVLDGDHRMLIVQVIAATLCAQTHVPYLSLCAVLVGVSFAVVVWRWVRARAVDRSSAWSAGIAFGVGALLWLPVFIDEVRRDPGNVTMLRRHFLDPPEAPQGLGVGIKTVLAHFDVIHLATRLPQRGADYFEILDDLEGGSWMVGLVVFAAWVGAAVWSWRLADRRIVRLHAVVAVATGVAVVSTSRIFGKVWYYLTLWAWVLGLLAVFATLWTAWAAIGPDRRRRIPIVGLSIGVLAATTAVFTVDAARVDPPEQHLGQILDDLVGPTADALDEGIGASVGKDGRYAVVWSDAYYFGSQGYGLISELERRGFDARAYPTYRVPVTPQRITTSDDVDAEVVLVTGVNVERWRDIPGVAEVAFVEPRSDVELAEFARLRDEVIDGLESAGRDDLVPLVDSNLFGLSVHPDLPDDLEPKVARMLVLGEETAVFIAPPGTFDANP